MSGGRRGALALRVLFVVVLGLQVAVWVRASMLYPELPERIPVHFNGAGEPDRWVARSAAAWFGLCVIPLALGAFVGGIAWWLPSLVRSAPALVNVPRKDAFLRLSPSGRLCVVRPVRLHLLWTIAAVETLFIVIQEGTARVAAGSWSSLPVWPVFAIVGAIVAPIPWVYVAVGRKIESEARSEAVAVGSGRT
ncbi:MAG: DUF1648 domain-containing protein [Planctomycetota bacterium]